MLCEMSEASYQAFFEEAVRAYAEDNVSSGRWKSHDAPELARAETERLLPRGLATPAHHLFDIRASGAGPTVGYLWAGALDRGSRKVAYVYQLLVLPSFRRQGHGRAALIELEGVARGLGFQGMALNVFGSNSAAQALYRSLGYVTTSMSMHKDLPRPAGDRQATGEAS
jgi:ribosomal protein S18 acetylase RimI-like enzyme